MKNKKILIVILVATIVFLSFTITALIFNHFKNKQNVQVVANTEHAIEEDVIEKNEIITWNVSEEENVINEENNIEETKTEPKDEDTKNNKETNKKTDITKTSTKSSKLKYYIKINISANVVNIYTQDDNGSYTVPYKSMICSTGTATPRAGNVYTISDRGAWGMMVGNVWAQYYVRINGAILFHSVPYTKRSKSNLEYWEYDKLGTKASAGCIRLTVKDSKWIYDNCPAGTKVEFYSDSNPGPFGKPTAQKISSESNYLRGWDPTDSDSNNPWKNVKTKDQEQSEDTTSNNSDTNKNTTNTNTTNESEKQEEVNNTNTTASGENTSTDKDTNSNDNSNTNENTINNTVDTNN